MTAWNFDISEAPRGLTETRTRTTTVKGETKESEYEVFIPKNIWAETTNGQVLISHFNPPTKTAPKGWWSMIGEESRIKCWQPFVKPEPSGVAA
jgi:hypothetical protein